MSDFGDVEFFENIEELSGGTPLAPDGEHNAKALTVEFNYVALRQKKDDIVIMDDYNVDNYPDLSKRMETLCKINNYKFTIKEVNLKQSRYFLIGTKM